MARIVMKFGGTSVADLDRIKNVARHVKREVDAGHEVAVVVSAMSGKTKELVGWVQGTPKVIGANSPFYDAREYDAVVASGEQITAGLLAMTLEGMGVNARSWQGWQLPIYTSNAHASARIEDKQWPVMFAGSIARTSTRAVPFGHTPILTAAA